MRPRRTGQSATASRNSRELARFATQPATQLSTPTSSSLGPRQHAELGDEDDTRARHAWRQDFTRRQARAAGGELKHHHAARAARPSRTGPLRARASARGGRWPAAGAAARWASPRSSSASRSALPPAVAARPPRCGRAIDMRGKQQRGGDLAVRRIDHHGRHALCADRLAHPRNPPPPPPDRACSAPQYRQRATATGGARPRGRSEAPVASITQSTVSSGASRRITGSIRLRTMSAGSATPLVSMTMWSGFGSRRSSVESVRSKSPSSEQQMQPLARLTTPSLAPAISSASMLIAPKSLTMAAMRRPSALARRWLTTVVLPAPRKPVTRRRGPA